MASRDVLVGWVEEALHAYDRAASVKEVAKAIWTSHRTEIERSEELLYSWQYDMRWAAHKLRKAGRLKPVNSSTRKWELADA